MTTLTVERNTEKKALQTPPNRRLPLKKVLSFLAWQMAAILFVEFVLFCAGLGEEEIFKLDPILGSKHMSNKRVTWRSEGFAQSYLNADGLREADVTVAKPLGVYRVALLGDSLTESLQVPLSQSFAQLVEKELNLEPGRKVQMLNFATSGYSTAQEYLQLKKQVLKYRPDLVLVCYNSRDIFENWSPADQVITNVRPYALHLPGGHLIVDSSSVTLWLRSPRAKILKQCEWLREHSRLWGLLSALELDLSMHNEPYRFVLTFLTKPGKAIREGSAACQKTVHSWLESFPAVHPASEPVQKPESAPAVLPAKSVATAVTNPKTVAASSPTAKNIKAEKPVDTNKIYKDLMTRTMGSLLAEMRQESARVNAKFALVTLPVRSALCPNPGMEIAFNNYKYEHELDMLKTICAEKNIPLLNCETEAEKLSLQEREKLFFAIHYSPYGQAFVAEQLKDFVREYTNTSSAGVNTK